MPAEYHLPPKFIFTVLSAITINARRSFRSDAGLALTGNHPFIKVFGKENIPTKGPCLILMNHYSHEGYIPMWSAFSITSLLPMESRWMMTYAWTSPNVTWDWFKRRLTRIVFTAICRVYGFIPMPPMPPDPREVTERTIAIRTLMALVRQRLPIALGMAPEGRDYPGALLGWPPSGMGRLLGQISPFFECIIPVGVYEENDQQVIHFGQKFNINVKTYSTKEEEDKEISLNVMRLIAKLLPEKLRGKFG